MDDEQLISGTGCAMSALGREDSAWKARADELRQCNASNTPLLMIQWLVGRGLLMPQQCIFTLTARPGAFDLNRKQAALQRLR